MNHGALFFQTNSVLSILEVKRSHSKLLKELSEYRLQSQLAPLHWKETSAPHTPHPPRPQHPLEQEPGGAPHPRSLPLPAPCHHWWSLPLPALLLNSGLGSQEGGVGAMLPWRGGNSLWTQTQPVWVCQWKYLLLTQFKFKTLGTFGTQ